MRLVKRICFAIILYSVLSGCTKETQPLLIGDWLWEGSSGGIAGVTTKPAPSERVIVRFSVDGQFTIRQNDTLSFSGKFHLTKARSIYSGKEESAIELEQVTNSNQVKNPRYVVIRGIVTLLTASQLSVGDNAYDGFGSSFVRN